MQKVEKKYGKRKGIKITNKNYTKTRFNKMTTN
jgi:hypothetical protein